METTDMSYGDFLDMLRAEMKAEKKSSNEDADMITTLKPLPRGSYEPAAAVAAAGALRWVPYDEAVSAVRGLLGASHEILRDPAQELRRSFSSVFFPGVTGQMPRMFRRPFAARQRFSEDAMVVCSDRPPLAPALQRVSRELVHVTANDASPAACDGFYDAVGELLRLLVGDAGRCTAAVDRTAFEKEFELEWVPEE